MVHSHGTAAWSTLIPMCHGAGGLAAQYRFGARTGGSVIMLGALKGEDVGKLVFAIFLVAGTLLSLLFNIDTGWLLSTSGH